MTLDKRILEMIKSYMGKLVPKKVLTTMEEVEANTNETNLAAAKVVAELNNKLTHLLNDLFITRSYTKGSNISPHNQESISFNIAVDGYTPIAVSSMTTSNTGVCIAGAYIKDSKTAQIEFYNTSGSTMSATRRIDILYIKSNLAI